MFFGAIFRTVKGGYDAYNIRKKLKEYKKELTQELFAPFSTYETFLASERLLMAEYMIELSKLKARAAKVETLIRLKERMNRRMKEIIAQAQTELEERSATKLDVARLVNGLRELSIAVDRDLVNFRKEIAADQKNLHHQLHDLGEQFLQLSDRIDAQANQTAAFERKINNFSKKINGFTSELEEITKVDLKKAKSIKFIWCFNIALLLVVIFLLIK
ncbi:MAG: hypothetical protein GXY86_07780 [Firmicutes bacterium]|nr:hypothetical protein [Bacillota bacterium]